MAKMHDGTGAIRLPALFAKHVPDDVAFIPEFTADGILLRAVKPQPDPPLRIVVPPWARPQAKRAATDARPAERGLQPAGLGAERNQRIKAASDKRA